MELDHTTIERLYYEQLKRFTQLNLERFDRRFSERR